MIHNKLSKFKFYLIIIWTIASFARVVALKTSISSMRFSFEKAIRGTRFNASSDMLEKSAVATTAPITVQLLGAVFHISGRNLFLCLGRIWRKSNGGKLVGNNLIIIVVGDRNDWSGSWNRLGSGGSLWNRFSVGLRSRFGSMEHHAPSLQLNNGSSLVLDLQGPGSNRILFPHVNRQEGPIIEASS